MRPVGSTGLSPFGTGAAEQAQGLGPITGDVVRRVVRGMLAKPARWVDGWTIPELEHLHDDELDGLAAVLTSIDATLALPEQAHVAAAGLTPKPVPATGERPICISALPTSSGGRFVIRWQRIGTRSSPATVTTRSRAVALSPPVCSGPSWIFARST